MTFGSEGARAMATIEPVGAWWESGDPPPPPFVEPDIEDVGLARHPGKRAGAPRPGGADRPPVHRGVELGGLGGGGARRGTAESCCEGQASAHWGRLLRRLRWRGTSAHRLH